MTREQAIEVLKSRYYSGVTRSRPDDEWRLATDTAIAALRDAQTRQEVGGMMREETGRGNVPDSWLDRCSNNGYERYIDENGDRRYCDNNELVSDNPFRPCAKCGEMPNEYGDDHCIQRLGNVMNACCGHGNRMGYIQFDSGHLIEGYFTVKIRQPNGEYL